MKKRIRGGICHAIHRYATSHLMYLDANNLYGWTTSQKLLVNSFEWIKELSQFNEDFITNYDQNDNEGYFLEVEIEYPKKLFNIYSDLPFLTERNKI